MHETSLVIAMCTQIEEMVKAQNAQKVVSITVRVGEFSGVEEEAFSFAFEVYKKEHPLFKEAVLKLEKVPALKRCLNCGEEFSYFQQRVCPRCQKEEIIYTGGEELEIAKLELLVED
ncbi:hydrogenase expression/synthesis HypA [Thermodesulfatator indicus DSM 15286]|uniref:Hydrogenase maturation factor HypA n=1 Tax=Thermodesulfatator indicus (strain DSM 15286 / JCM 11887 / CIR29812) TaxID=667014 RepID=F8A9X7_THEID|nr:hydrogenase maturation nickel metallochaperone HypA [Thermodesulfatator indicus]AEH44177.1 hydrogenase expression/synthesis HypA [Thermodesulfatator indicus DSM 15286]